MANDIPRDGHVPTHIMYGFPVVPAGHVHLG